MEVNLEKPYAYEWIESVTVFSDSYLNKSEKGKRAWDFLSSSVIPKIIEEMENFSCCLNLLKTKKLFN